MMDAETIGEGGAHLVISTKDGYVLRINKKKNNRRQVLQACAYERQVAVRCLGREFVLVSQAVRLPREYGSKWAQRQKDARSLNSALEIKPKASDRVRSWLIAPEHAQIKSNFSRLQIVRAAKGCLGQYALHEKLWSKSKEEALSALICMSEECGHLWKWYSKDSNTQPSAEAIAVVALALEREPLLSRLQAIQRRYDFLDVDGVTELLKMWPRLRKGPPCCGPKQSRRLEHIANVCRAEPAHFEAASAEERDQRRNTALRNLRLLTKQEAAEALRRWLIALAFDDVSIIVAFRKLPCNDNEPPRQQSEDSTGICHIPDLASTFEYSISVTDCGPKPYSKLAEKSEKEFGLCHRASVVLLSSSQSSSFDHR
mmetsp:Transcript_4178/g.5875  ORF Transcript_4178/g.5875 Transcript_4178/m.5875 type:complete len:371 (-) Transcript_4178:1803-2915(-)|eukprot:CAMPEP_0197290494 /NCGR_PEP_ID=MMETSP0890-20130614/7703_1 /TAXON_ID=44058 ORGANISM="Aureoumbra lagunensis, Strain CCMP1510" /NCGR_SAMPLE_ID=MMETSP0890 /ASSEMBLY_ACC=CAM_ASM_000533 /LENGTH=370 /DNA_ID=CAMNT_0042762513 /DNA_START=74 /DNA_END=1186 /DNA_ORIENTATION=-